MYIIRLGYDIRKLNLQFVEAFLDKNSLGYY
jgi:hypothetical protein